MNVYLSGMIGSGKTTLGEMLAERLGFGLVDLDREMNRRLGYSFHDLVREKGWLPFRELEYSICKDFSRLPWSVVCLGGGTVRYEWNIDVLRGTGIMILLEASEDELIRRVSLADRPRVNTGTTLEEDIRRMWREHGDIYRRTADYIVRSDRESREDELEELLSVVIRDARFSHAPVPRELLSRYRET